MKKLILSLLLLSTPAWAAFTHMGCEIDASSGASLNCQTTNNSNNNDIQIVFAAYPSTNSITGNAPTSTFGISWTRWQHFAFTQGVNYTLDMWCGFVGTNGGSKNTVTITFGTTSAVFVYLSVTERTDLTYSSCAAALDTFGAGAGLMSGQNTTTPPYPSGNATTTNNNDVIIGLGGASGAGVNHIAAGSGFTAIDTGVNGGIATEYMTVATAGTSTNTVFTNGNGTSQGWGVVGVFICPGNCVSGSATQPWFGPIN